MKQCVILGWLLTGLFMQAFGQSQPVTYDFRGVPLSQVLEKLHEQTQVDFAYDNFATSKVLITHRATSMPLQQALSELLAPTSYDFLLVGSTYIIAKRLQEEKLTPMAFHDILSSIEVSGTIYDAESKETLPFVTIYNQSSRQSFMTNEFGQFHCAFQMAHPEDTILFQFIGFESNQILLRQLIDQKPNALINLLPSRLFLPAVMVSAGSDKLFERDSENTNLLFNPNDLVTADGMGESDIFRSTQLLPGVSSNQENNGGLTIRGGATDQTLMLLDGFTIYHQDHLFGMFSAVNSHSVKNVRVIKSTPQSRYGGRIGGIVEMIGKEGSTQDVITQVQLGMLSGSLSVEGPLDTAGKLGFIFNGRRAFTDGWYSPVYRSLFTNVYNSALINSDTTRTQPFENDNNPTYYFQDGNVKFTWRPNSHHKFNATGYASMDQLYINYADTVLTANSLAPKVRYTDESRWKNAGMSLQYLYQRKPGAHLMLRMTVSNYNASYFSTDTIATINNVVTTRIQNIETNLRNIKYTAEKQWVWLDHSVNVGMESEHMVSKRNYTYSTNAFPASTRSTWWHSVFAQDAWSPSLRWRFNAGWRMTYDRLSKNLLQEPRLTMTYRWPLQRLRLEVGYARLHQLIQRVRAQNLYQNSPDYWALSDGNEIPILRSNQWNINLQKEFTKGNVNLDVFARVQSGSTLLLTSLPGYAQDVFENDLLIHGTSQSHGAELSAFVQHRRHQLLASYTWMSTTGRYDALDNQVIVSSGEHRHEIKLYYEWQSSRWDYGVFWTFGSGRPYTPLLGSYDFINPNGDSSSHVVFGNFNSDRLPAYHRLDLSIQYKTNWEKAQMEIGASLYNAYNRTNIRSREYFAYPKEEQLAVYESNLYMLGWIPSLNIQLRF